MQAKKKEQTRPSITFAASPAESTEMISRENNGQILHVITFLTPENKLAIDCEFCLFIFH